MKSWAPETNSAAPGAGYTLQPTIAATATDAAATDTAATDAAAEQQNQTGWKQITPTKTTAAKCQFGNVIYTHIALCRICRILSVLQLLNNGEALLYIRFGKPRVECSKTHSPYNSHFTVFDMRKSK